MKNDCKICFRLDSSTRNILIEYSNKLGISSSNLVRNIVKSYLRDKFSQVQPSDSAAGDLYNSDNEDSPFYHLL